MPTKIRIEKQCILRPAIIYLFWSIIAMTMHWHIGCTTVAGKTLRMALANGKWHHITVSYWLKWIWNMEPGYWRTKFPLSRVVWTCKVRRQLVTKLPTLSTLIMSCLLQCWYKPIHTSKIEYFELSQHFLLPWPHNDGGLCKCMYAHHHFME